jgi:AcrR family transcriptional regulator
MTSAPRTRQQQRASSETAILDAAVTLYASAGPDGVSMRDVAGSAGVTHPLVSRYFGSKGGLLGAVGDRLTAHVRAETNAVSSYGPEGFAELLRSARDDPSMTKLLIRSALGDLQPAGFPACLGGQWARSSARNDPGVDHRSRICQYAASSLLLGWLTFDGFLTSAVGLRKMSDRRRDQAMAATAAHLWTLAAAAEPRLEPRRIAAEAQSRRPPAPGDQRAHDALLASAIELFAQHGPASVSIRDIARHAHVNHGLVHRHFGSKDDLITEAIEVGVSPLLPGALAPDGFDIDEVVRVMHHDSTPAKLIARTLVDDVAIGSVRHTYPLMHALVAAAQHIPAQSRPNELADPRLAAAAAGALVGGSVIWGASLRTTIGLPNNVQTAMADLSRHLLGVVPPLGPDRDEPESV